MFNVTPMELKPGSKPRYIHGESDKYFNFQYHIGDIEEFDLLTSRWVGREAMLEKITSEILHEKHNWCEILRPQGSLALPHLSQPRGGYTSSSGRGDYHRDLRGLSIENIHTSNSISGLDWAFLDWSEFTKCNFLLENSSKMIFFNSDLSHCKFTTCAFRNGWFYEGNMKNTVFYDCTFESVDFNKNSALKDNYSNIVFMNCKFNNVDFSRIDLRNVCFTGNCEFANIKIDNEDLMPFSAIGARLLETFRHWDGESWHVRRKIKSIKYQGDQEPVIEVLPGKKTRPHRQKYRSLQATIKGLICFYEHVASTRDNHTNREIFSRAHYVLSWLIDRNRILSSPLKGCLKSFPGRYLTGYGDRPETPIIAWLVVIMIFAILSGLSGIRIAGIDTSFGTVLATGELKNIGEFFLECLYFSTITATTVGYGDITPTPGLTMFFSAMNAAIGMFLYTTFTVVIVRRLLR